MPSKTRPLAYFAGATVLLMQLPGCASYVPAPMSATATAREIETRSLGDPRLSAFIGASAPVSGEAPAPGTWTLDRLTLAALYYHPDLAIARAKLRAADAGIVTARQIPNPALNFAASFDTPGTPLTVGALVNFLVETFGKRETRVEQADALAEAARQDLLSAVWLVRGRVRGALLDLLVARQRLAGERARLGLEQQLTALLEQRLAAGVTSTLDVTRARIARDQTALAASDAERSVNTARAALATAIGIDVRALDGVRLSFGAFDRARLPNPIARSGELRRQALLNRADVRSSLASYAAAEAALKLQLASQFPNILAGPSYSYDQGANKYGLSLAADLPIFNRNEGPVAEAEAKREAAAASFEALQNGIIGAIERASADYAGASKTLKMADSLLAEGRKREAEVSASLAAGQADRSALVEAQIEVAALELSRFDAKFHELQALGALEDALQQPLFGSSWRAGLPETGAGEQSL